MHAFVYQLFACMEPVFSEYVEQLSVEAKERYTVKLAKILCTIDPYIDTYFHYSEELPGVTYEQIYDYLVNNLHSSNVNQSAFKSLDAYRTVCVEGWLSSLQVR